MKLRIKGNSIRLRLSKTDVKQLSETGTVSDKISFGSKQLAYTLQAAEIDRPEAAFNTDNITVSMPKFFADDWYTNSIVGIDGTQINGNDSLYILIEKDFQCLDETTEDQSDNYVNPNSVC